MECSWGSFGYSGMARRKYSDGVAAHTDTEGDEGDCDCGWVIDSGGGIYCRAR